MRVSPTCYDTAKTFLRHVKGARREDEQELAEAIEKLCQEFVGSIAADEAGEEV